MKKIILNLAIFQIGWIVAILGGNLYAFLYTVFAIAIHQQFVVEHVSEWKLIGIIVLVGFSWAMVMTQAQILFFPDADIFGIPLWLICLWVLFATMFQHCLRWLQPRRFLSAFFAAVFGPLSYWFGTQISSAEMAEPLWFSIIILSVGWAVFFPCGMHLAQKARGEPT
jgi:hypothetical protein